MNCEDHQNRLIELTDQGMSAPDDTELQAHLSTCADCREFLATWVHLDMKLSEYGAGSALPKNFKATLLAALPEPVPRLLPLEIARRRRELEAEYQNALAALPGHCLISAPAKLLKAAAVVGGFVFGGIAVMESFRAVMDWNARGLDLGWPAWMTVLSVSGCVGVLFQLRQRLRPVTGLVARFL
jgi:anti-sigma factor RsiW